jgi:hypothetical protein
VLEDATGTCNARAMPSNTRVSDLGARCPHRPHGNATRSTQLEARMQQQTIVGQHVIGDEEHEHTHPPVVHTHDHYHVSHHHTGGVLGQFEHRTHYHEHEHNHSPLVHAHSGRDQESERRDHESTAHTHDHEAPTGGH